METKRYLELDLLRTIAILLMVIYHLSFDLAYFYRVPIDPFSGGLLTLQRVTANLFLLLVGASFAVSYGRMETRGATQREIMAKYARRGFLVLLCGMLVTLVTFLINPGTYVRFGVLHLIGTGILLLPFLMPLREANAIAAIAAFLFGQIVANMSASTPLLLPLGIHPSGFVSVDYFPLFPWIASILAGAAMGNFLYNRGLLRWHLPCNRWTRAVTEPGRHALVIYLLHQPILLALLWATTPLLTHA